jgi:hypothetical protein
MSAVGGRTEVTSLIAKHSPGVLDLHFVGARYPPLPAGLNVKFQSRWTLSAAVAHSSAECLECAIADEYQN